MIYCVWYPGGGFGHFVNAILTLYGEGFARTSQQNFDFDTKGTSHSLKLVAPKYFHEPSEYNFAFDPEQNYSVLIDNGNHNESIRFLSFFPDAQVIKIYYSDWSWPIIAYTMLDKTSPKMSLESELSLQNDWPVNENWAVREKYFLYLRDHDLRSRWRSSDAMHNLDVADMLTYSNFESKLQSFGIKVDRFQSLWRRWFGANQSYLEPVLYARKIIQSLQTGKTSDLCSMKNTWTQAVMYYFLWLTYNVEVPHNDYKEWFTSTKDIVKMLEYQGVSVDKN